MYVQSTGMGRAAGCGVRKVKETHCLKQRQDLLGSTETQVEAADEEVKLSPQLCSYVIFSQLH